MSNYTDDEFETRFELFAAICGNDYFPWRTMKARKEHVDEFGKMISQDEIYFRKEVGGVYERALKMSKASMDSLLFILFADNRHLLEIAIREAQNKEERKRKAMDEAVRIINQFRKGS